MKAQAYARTDDPQTSFYERQKKTLEINPRHPLVKNLLERAQALAEADEDGDESVVDESLLDTARVLIDTARLRSGFTLKDSVEFAARIERMLRLSAGVSLDAVVEAEPELPSDEDEEDEEDEEVDAEEEYEEEEEEEAAADEEEEEEQETAADEEEEEEGADNEVTHEEL